VNKINFPSGEYVPADEFPLALTDAVSDDKETSSIIAALANARENTAAVARDTKPLFIVILPLSVWRPET